MSSTNRSADHYAKRAGAADYYVTPVPAITAFLEAFYADFPALFGHKLDMNGPWDILDPCAGGDGSHDMSYPVALRCSKFPIRRLTTIDIRQDSRAEYKEDYLKSDIQGEGREMIITNPPFNLALQVIQKALADVTESGLVIMLLRLNFFGSKARKTFFDSHMPVACYVHSQRMKFSDSSGTDSVEYMHAIWQRNNHPHFTHLRII